MLDPSQKPSIEYPCEWEYRIIGMDPDRIRRTVGHVVGEVEHNLHVVRSNGKYWSLSLSLIVRDESHRLEVYRELSSSVHVKMVL